VAEWLWQRRLAGDEQADPEALAAKILKTGQADIDALWSELGQQNTWLILANGPAPD